MRGRPRSKARSPHSCRYRWLLPAVEQPFWQQGGVGDALLAQHWARLSEITSQVAAWDFRPASQQLVFCSQHAALSLSQQATALSQQRVLLTQHAADLLSQQPLALGAAFAPTAAVPSPI